MPTSRDMAIFLLMTITTTTTRMTTKRPITLPLAHARGVTTVADLEGVKWVRTNPHF